MRKGSKLTTEQKMKLSEILKRKYVESGGFTDLHRQRLSESKRRHDAEVARKIAIADAILDGGL